MSPEAKQVVSCKPDDVNLIITFEVKMKSIGPPEEVDKMSTVEEISVKDETGSNTTIDFKYASMHF